MSTKKELGLKVDMFEFKVDIAPNLAYPIPLAAMLN